MMRLVLDVVLYSVRSGPVKNPSPDYSRVADLKPHYKPKQSLRMSSWNCSLRGQISAPKMLLTSFINVYKCTQETALPPFSFADTASFMEKQAGAAPGDGNFSRVMRAPQAVSTLFSHILLGLTRPPFIEWRLARCTFCHMSGTCAPGTCFSLLRDG